METRIAELRWKEVIGLRDGSRFGYVEDMEDAKDIVQELFVRLWEGNMTFENEQALSSYLYSGVFHACLNFRKLNSIHERHHQEILYQQGTVDESNYVNGRIEHEVLWEVFQAVDDLPEESRKREEGGMGIRNLRRRLDLLYPQHYALFLGRCGNCYSAKLKIRLQ